VTPLLLIAGLALAGYVLSLRIWPVKACGRCGGSGKLRSPSGRSWRNCPRCKGSGGRVRIGRRVMDGLGSGARNL
jgi:DnaJ-class molecular chaperone